MNKSYFYSIQFSIPHDQNCTIFGNGFSYDETFATGVTSKISRFIYDEDMLCRLKAEEIDTRQIELFRIEDFVPYENCGILVEAKADKYSSAFSRKITLKTAYDGKYGWDSPLSAMRLTL